MYKAIKEIGGYKPGDVVPDSEALVWLQMYSVPHVEKVKGDLKDNKEKPKKVKSKRLSLK